MSRTSLRTKLAAVAATGVMALGTGVLAASPAAASGGTVHGCPSGSVCIYPRDAGWNNDRPSHQFSANRAHDLSGQEGYHYVLNNQTGGWRAWFCTGYGGGGTWYGPLYQDQAVNVNLSPINSIFVGP